MTLDDGLAWLATQRGSIQTVAFFTGFLAIGAAEAFWPWRRPVAEFGERWGINLLLFLANGVGISLLVPEPAVLAQRLTLISIPELLDPITGSRLPAIFVGFLLLDLSRYATHALSHAVPVLWRLHAVHHSDRDLDVTSTFRHHPLEYALTFATLWLTIGVFGIPIESVALYAVLASIFAFMQHGNYRLPPALTRLLGTTFVTADVHAIHHSTVIAEGNSNYGMMFVFWDRLFSTYTPPRPDDRERIAFGVSDIAPKATASLRGILMLPFRGAVGGTADRTRS